MTFSGRYMSHSCSVVGMLVVFFFPVFVLGAGQQGDICGTGHPPCETPLYCDIPYGQEYGTCSTVYYCGNYSCAEGDGETHANCPVDCYCGDGVCHESDGETSTSCPQDCGCDEDERCESGRGETVILCPENDCGCDGDELCDPLRGETVNNCSDCVTCNGNGNCQGSLGENQTTCPSDCDGCDNDYLCESNLGENDTTCPDCWCGNGELDTGEECDPNSEEPGPGCDASWASWECYSNCQTCEETPTCGNGEIEIPLGEPCDTASSATNFGCAVGATCVDRSYRGAGCVCQPNQPPVDDMTCDISLTDCQQPCFTNEKPFDVFFVMDVSYSMVLGHKLNIMKASFNSIIDALPSGSRASLIVFNPEATLKRPLTDNLSGVRTRDPTDLYGGDYPEENSLTNYIAAFDALEQEVSGHKASGSFSGRNQLVYFFSDGEPTIGGPFQYVIPQANNECYTRGTVRGKSGYICDVGCAVANDSCQFDAAVAMADDFHDTFPTLPTIAIGLDVQQQHHYILADHVATPGLFSAISSSQVAPGAWGITGFCNKLDTLSAHPLTHFVDQFCEMSCETPLCKVYTGTYTTQPASNTPTGCLSGTYTDMTDSPNSWQWKCTGTDGTTQFCGATRITPPSGPMCSELEVTLLTGMTYQFACTGSGNTYQIVIQNNQGTPISTLSGATGTYTFATGGTYTATCYVDGVTGELCPGDPDYVGTTLSPISPTSPVPPTSSSSFGTASRGVQQPAMGTDYFQRTTTTATIKEVLSKADRSTISETSKPSSVFFSPLQTLLNNQFSTFTPCYNPCEKTITVVPPVPERFDLALRKTLLQPKPTYVSGDSVTFQIELINQGTLPASKIMMVDYVPNGLTLNDPKRTYETANKQALLTYTSVLLPGQSGIVTITFVVNGSTTGMITNRAEILEDNNTDADSTPNNKQNDDCFGGDDIVSGNGLQATNTSCTPTTDEDDHDPASLTVGAGGSFDLRIKKDVSAGPYTSGQVITYTVTVLNTGSLVASGLITDILPVGLSYVSGLTVIPSLQPGTSTINSDDRQTHTLLNKVAYEQEVSLVTGTWNLLELWPGETVIFSYKVKIGVVSGPAKNIISVIPSGTGEIIPYVTGSCITGHNPLINDNAVLGTNNTDCEEIAIQGSACEVSFNPPVTTIEGSSYSMIVQCSLLDMTGTIAVDCGNGTTGLQQTTTSAQCNYVGHGTYTATCLVDGQKISGCNKSLTLKGGGDPNSICASITPSITKVHAKKHDVDVVCKIDNLSSASSVSIDCGNGTKIPGTQATCELRGYGDYTIQCLADGKTVEKCSTKVTLEGGSGCSGCGKPSSITCGNGTLDPGEACDEGIKNGKGICSTSCTFKVVDPDPVDFDAPKCAFVDPPSVQMGEYVPFWRDLDDETDVVKGNNCTEKTQGAIRFDETMQCHFYVQAPGGKKYPYTRDCYESNLKSVGRYKDLQKDLKTKIMPRRGQSVLPSSEWKASGYGEYALVLDRISYDICTGVSMDTTTSGKQDISYEFVTQEYNGRVCQFNFAVTAPYMMQKGSSLSSFADDRSVLQSFHLLDGRSILSKSEMQGINFLSQTSTTNTFDDIQKYAYDQVAKIVNPIEKTHPLRRSIKEGTIKKATNQELYLIQEDVVIQHVGSSSLNLGKPTTVIVKGPHTVTIVGSLPANLLLVVPEGTVEFKNTDCDANDTVSGLLIAKYIKTTSSRATLTNTLLQDKRWCSGGQLIIKGLLVMSNPEMLYALRNTRRSTLQRWFDGTKSKAQHIYDGASLRIDAHTESRRDLPPLAQQSKLVFTLQSKDNALMTPIYLDPLTLPFYIQMMASAGLISEVK